MIIFFRSPSHAANNGRSPEPRAIPPCKPPPSRPPPTIDDLSNGGSGNPSSNSNNNNIGNSNTNTSTPTNVPKSHSSHSVATPTGRQPKSVRTLGNFISFIHTLPVFTITSFLLDYIHSKGHNVTNEKPFLDLNCLI